MKEEFYIVTGSKELKEAFIKEIGYTLLSERSIVNYPRLTTENMEIGKFQGTGEYEATRVFNLPEDYNTAKKFFNSISNPKEFKFGESKAIIKDDHVLIENKGAMSFNEIGLFYYKVLPAMVFHCDLFSIKPTTFNFGCVKDVPIEDIEFICKHLIRKNLIKE